MAVTTVAEVQPPSDYVGMYDIGQFNVQEYDIDRPGVEQYDPTQGKNNLRLIFLVHRYLKVFSSQSLFKREMV